MTEPNLECPPLPFAWGVLYTAPNPDGTRKMCQNCMMWSYADQRCSIHRADLRIAPDDVCGYHVFGMAMEYRMDHPGMMPVDEKTSGLDTVPGGTSCDICVYYEPTGKGKGICHAVAKEKTALPPQPVEAMGCCARWESVRQED